jgi:CubicO group peptidase (beta-lactamase class C family)
MNLDTHIPMHIDALFHHASVTKLFVATALLQLRDHAKLDLDAPVVSYLPYFRLNDPRYRTITVRQMMQHNSGMPDTEEFEWENPNYDEAALENYVRSISDLALESEPGTRCAYSNIAYEVLGDVIAKVSGLSFEEYIAQNILVPLGMKTATLLLRQADMDLMATPHTHTPYPEGPVRVSTVFPYNREHGPSSTLYASVLDTSRFALAYLNGGALDGMQLLSAETIAEMWDPTVTTGKTYWKGIGLTWFVSEMVGQKIVGHDGEDVGFSSGLSLAPALGSGVIVLCNADGTNIEEDGDAILALLIREQS